MSQVLGGIVSTIGSLDSFCMPMRSAGGLGMPHLCALDSSLRSSLRSFLDPRDHWRLDPVFVCVQDLNYGLFFSSSPVTPLVNSGKVYRGIDASLDVGSRHCDGGLEFAVHDFSTKILSTHLTAVMPLKGITPLSLLPCPAIEKKAAARGWLMLDSTGDSIMLDVDKYAIMHRAGIHARDLRILDPLLSYPSTILGRERAIVINLEHIKAIITAEEVLLRNPHDEYVIPIVEELSRRLPPKCGRKHVNACALAEDLNGLEEPESKVTASWVDPQNDTSDFDVPPFEFRALEVALEAICSYLDARTTELESAAYPALEDLTKKISSRNLDHVRKLKSRMTRLTARVQKVRDELEQLLNDDDDMADMFLTRKMAGVSSPVAPSVHGNWAPASPTTGSRIYRASRASTLTSYIHGSADDVEELEMLLEAYFMQIDGTLHKVTTLREYIDDTEDYINIQLDNHRNRLIQLELVLSSATVMMTIYSLITAIFGMNLPFTWNDGYGYLFKWVVILAGLGSFLVFLIVLAYARYKRLIGT